MSPLCIRCVIYFPLHFAAEHSLWQANVLSVSDGLFRESALAVAKNYPDIKVIIPILSSTSIGRAPY